MPARSITYIVTLCCIAVLPIGCEPPIPTADMVLRNGKIITVDSTNPEVEAVAIIGSTIRAVGSNAFIAAYIGDDTEVIDLEGRLAIPGFIEGHGHYMGLGQAKQILDLTQADSWDDIVQMVAEAVQQAEPGAWIRGRGWHQEKWESVPEQTVEGVPTHHDLSAVSPENPVVLGHASGHAAFANELALQLGGISSETPDPPGGEIVHDIRGEPTGLLRENADAALYRALDEYRSKMSPEEREAERREQVQLAGLEALRKGITSFQDAGTSFEGIDFLKSLADAGELPIRLYVMVRGESNEEMDQKLSDYRMIGYGDEFLTVRSIKRQIDGALGSHGAWLLEPYADMPSSTGLVLEPVDDIAGTAEIAIKYGYQVNTHAIGDRANRVVLDIYEKVFQANPNTQDLRWRIEHAQHIHPDDLPRFSELGVIASMQGIHCTSDAPWVYRRLGAERAESGAYMWRTLWDLGAVVTNGTDVPVEDIDPLVSFYATVTRRQNDGEVFFPEQRLTRAEALQSYTLNNAYAAFEEGTKGSISPGKLADIVVLSKDIMTIPEEEILQTEVVYTILGGEVVWSK